METKIVPPMNQADDGGKKAKRNKRTRQRVNTPTHTPTNFGPQMTGVSEDVTNSPTHSPLNFDPFICGLMSHFW